MHRKIALMAILPATVIFLVLVGTSDDKGEIIKKNNGMPEIPRIHSIGMSNIQPQ